MIRTCTIKLRRGRRRDAARLDEVLWRCRALYNGALEQRIEDYRKQHKSLSFFDQCKELTALRAEDEHYAALDATMTRLTVMRRLDLAFKAFYRRCKTGEQPGFPRFRGRDRFDTLVFGTSGWKLSGGKLTLKGIGWFRVAGELHREGQPKGLRLVRRAGRWYAQVVLDVGPAPAIIPAKRGVGIDVGIKVFATMSDGTTVAHPRFLRRAAAELRRSQQALSRKRRGSHRRSRAKAELARLHARIANRRTDFVRQAAAALDSCYDGFAVERLAIAQMVEQVESLDGMSRASKRGLRRGIMDSAWGAFTHALACKAEEAGKPLVQVSPRDTTQRCSGCGSLVRKTLRDRVHDCAACGLVIDRDLNAARNINDLGWRSAGSSACGESR